MAETRAWRGAGWVLLAAALALLVAWPLIRLFAEGLSGGLGAIPAAIGSDGLVAVANSLWLAAAVTALSVALALGFALLTERTVAPGRRWLRLAVLAPLILPDFVSAIGWTRAYGPSGLSDQLFGVTLPGLYGPAGVVLAMSVSALPLAYVVVVGGMRVRAEPDLVRAARSSGADALTAFRTVTLPVLAPTLAAAGGLVFITSMNAFGTPAVLGRPAGFFTMTTRIYQDLAFSASDAAFNRVIGLASLLVVIAVVMVALVDRAAPIALARSGAAPGPGGSGARVSGWVSAAAWLFVALAIAVPGIALLLTAMLRAVGLPPVPGNLTFANFAAALDGHALAAMANSIGLAVAAAVGAVGLGLLATVVPSGRWRRRVGTAVTFGFAVPGSVLAVAVLLAFGATLRDTLAIILLAYLGKLWALGQRPIGGAIDGLPADLRHAARVHGAGPLAAARTIILPLLAPALTAAALLVFVFAIHEVTISVLLYGPTTTTLAVAVLNLQQLGDPTVTSALAVLLTVFVAAGVSGLALVGRLVPWTSVGVG